MNIKRETDSNIVIVRDFNTPLKSMYKSSRQKISKETVALNKTLDHMDLIDIFRAFHSKIEEHTFCPNEHGTFSEIDHMLSHKTGLKEFNNIEIISSIFSNHNGMKQGINHKRKKWKTHEDTDIK